MPYSTTPSLPFWHLQPFNLIISSKIIVPVLNRAQLMIHRLADNDGFY